jgi:hypothetical protein
MSYEEEDTCMSYEEEDTCMSKSCTALVVAASPPAAGVKREHINKSRRTTSYLRHRPQQLGPEKHEA